jgi:hypothetical protein
VVEILTLEWDNVAHEGCYQIKRLDFMREPLLFRCQGPRQGAEGKD